MRLLGVAREGINKFCNLMDIRQGISNNAYANIVKHIHFASKNVFEDLCEKAVKEEKKENEKHKRPLSHLKIFGMEKTRLHIALWSNHAHRLLYWESHRPSCKRKLLSNLHLYLLEKRKNEREFEEWYEEHAEECAINHSGFTGKMEVDAVKEMFLRSEDKYNVKYNNYIGDGDSKTYKVILDLNPYDNDFVCDNSAKWAEE